MNQPYRLFVGIDWAKDEHTICVLDAERKVIERRTIEHGGTGLGQLADALTKLSEGEPGCVAVAIETYYSCRGCGGCCGSGKTWSAVSKHCSRK